MSDVAYQIPKLVHAQSESKFGRVAVVVVDERLIRSPDHEPLQFLHERNIRPTVSDLPRIPLQTVLESAHIQMSIEIRHIFYLQYPCSIHTRH